jgi:hypothetical protein
MAAVHESFKKRAADLADPHQGLARLEQREHRETPLERLGHARITRWEAHELITVARPVRLTSR